MLATMGVVTVNDRPSDPANKWVRNMYASSNLQIIKLTQKDSKNARKWSDTVPVYSWRTYKRNSIQFEPSCWQVFKRGRIFFTLEMLMCRTTMVNSITTKLANPHYFPGDQSHCNNTVTSTTEDQLLVDVIKTKDLIWKLARTSLL